MPATSPADPRSAAAIAFIARWQGVKGTNASELASSHCFVTELCALPGVPAPSPNGAQDYQFERPISFQHRDGSTTSPARPVAMSLAEIEARLKGRGASKKSLPRILETLESLGRARRDGALWRP